MSASRRVAADLAPAFVNCVIYGCGGAVLGLLACDQSPVTQLGSLSVPALAALVWLGVVPSAVSGQMFLRGVRTLGVSRTVVFIYLIPVVTALLSALLLGDRFTLWQAAGGSAVLAGVWFSAPARRG